MSAKDYGLAPVKVNAFVHGIAKHQQEVLVKGQKDSSSLVAELSALVLEAHKIPQVEFRRLMVPRLHTWGKPWRWLYIREEVRPVLTLLVDSLNQSLPERYLETLPQRVNASNLLSALILAKAIEDRLVFKAQHVESNNGYRIAVNSPRPVSLKS